MVSRFGAKLYAGPDAGGKLSSLRRRLQFPPSPIAAGRPLMTASAMLSILMLLAASAGPEALAWRPEGRRAQSRVRAVPARKSSLLSPRAQVSARCSSLLASPPLWSSPSVAVRLLTPYQ